MNNTVDIYIVKRTLGRIQYTRLPLAISEPWILVSTQTYHSSPYLPALMQWSLITSRRVDAVWINIPLLSLGNFKDFFTFLRGVLRHIIFTSLPQLHISFIGDKPMCPPILKCALVVMVIVNYRISNLEHWPNTWLFLINYGTIIQYELKKF